MVKVDPELLNELAELELQALLEGLQDPELRRNPSFLEKVRKFMKDNRLETTPDTPGVQQLQKAAEKLPVFDNEVNIN